VSWTNRWLCSSVLLGVAQAASVDTPLHRAAYEDDLASAQALIQKGADVKAANLYGVTPLSLACTNGNTSMIKLLLKAGADPNAALPGGETALMTAARSGHVDAVKALIAGGADVKAREDRRKQTPLMWAAAEGHVDVVKELIKAGADVKARLASGFTPLLFAVREGHIGVAKTLIEFGASVNDTIQPSPAAGRLPGASRTGTSAVLLATINGHFELGSELLNLGADPNQIASGWAAIHAVSGVRKPGGGDNNPAPRGSGSMTSLEFLKVLKAKGADMNLRMTRKINVGLTSLNTAGATAFVIAARSGDSEMMRTLAALGADPLIPTADGATALIVAAGLGTRSPGEDPGTEAEVIEAVKVALELGNNIDAVDKNGETAMHGAAYKNLPGVVRLLAERGANPAVWNKKNKQGWTPLIIAEGYRFGNYKPSVVTVAAFHEVMKKAGIEIPPPTVLPPTKDYVQD
jgi:ankyrin repeat protein